MLQFFFALSKALIIAGGAAFLFWLYPGRGPGKAYFELSDSEIVLCLIGASIYFCCAYFMSVKEHGSHRPASSGEIERRSMALDAAHARMREAQLRVEEAVAVFDFEKHLLKLKLTREDWDNLRQFVIEARDGKNMVVPTHLLDHAVVKLVQAGRVNKAGEILAGSTQSAWRSLERAGS